MIFFSPEIFHPFFFFNNLSTEQDWEERCPSARVQVSSRVRTSVAVCSPWWFPKDRKDSLIQAELLTGLPDCTFYPQLVLKEFRDFFSHFAKNEILINELFSYHIKMRTDGISTRYG